MPDIDHIARIDHIVLTAQEVEEDIAVMYHMNLIQVMFHLLIIVAIVMRLQNIAIMVHIVIIVIIHHIVMRRIMIIQQEL